jgi:hypothetical protein
MIPFVFSWSGFIKSKKTLVKIKLIKKIAFNILFWVDPQIWLKMTVLLVFFFYGIELKFAIYCSISKMVLS